MTDYLAALILLAVSLLALRKKENTYDLLLQGGSEGLKLLLTITPALVVLLTAVTMLRASGAVELLTRILSPIFRLAGIPPETVMLILIRPISGSAALAVGAELMTQYGPDSLIGRTAAIMLGSTETTFYTLSIYFAQTRAKKLRYCLFCALLADLTGSIVGSLLCKFI